MKQASKAALLFLVLALSPRCFGQTSHPFNNASISVQVRNPDNSAAGQGILVELLAENMVPIDQSQTDSSGKCRFIPTSPAIYVVRARAPGYLDVSSRLDMQNTQTAMAFLVLRVDPRHVPPPEVAGGTASASDLAVPESARKAFAAGQKALDDHDIDKGIEYLKKAIQAYPSYPQAYTLLGAAYLEQKNYKDAQISLQKAVELDPKSAGAYLELGAVLNIQKDYPGAVTALTKGLEINPDVPAVAEYELAKAYMAQQQWQNAEVHLRKAIAKQLDLAAAHVSLGNVLLKKGDGPGALEEFQTYLKLDPSGPMAAGVKDIIPKIQAAIAKQQPK